MSLHYLYNFDTDKLDLVLDIRDEANTFSLDQIFNGFVTMNNNVSIPNSSVSFSGGGSTIGGISEGGGTLSISDTTNFNNTAEFNGLTSINIVDGFRIIDENLLNYYVIQTGKLHGSDIKLNLPALTADDTFAIIGITQTWTGANSFTGAGDFLFTSTGITIYNPAQTFKYTLTSAAILANRVLNLPLITGTDTLAVLGLAQTYTTTRTINNGTDSVYPLILNGTSAGSILKGISFRDGGVEYGWLGLNLGYYGITAATGIFFGIDINNFILVTGGIANHTIATGYQFNVGFGGLEVSIGANLMLFENGAVDTGFGWSTSGVLDFTVALAIEMSLAADSLTFNNGATDTALNWATNGLLYASGGDFGAIAGTSTTVAKHHGTIDTNTTQTGNSALTETVLFATVLGANTFDANKDRISFSTAGTFANTVSVDKRVKVQYPSGNTIFDTGALAITAANRWVLNGEIVRISTSGVKTWVTFENSSSTLSATASGTTIGSMISFTAGSTILIINGNGTNASDTVGEMHTADWYSAP